MTYFDVEVTAYFSRTFKVRVSDEGGALVDNAVDAAVTELGSEEELIDVEVDVSTLREVKHDDEDPDL